MAASSYLCVPKHKLDQVGTYKISYNSINRVVSHLASIGRHLGIKGELMSHMIIKNISKK